MSLIVLLTFLLSVPQDPQIPPIAIIDFYGLRSVTEQQARAALQIKEGDVVADEPKDAKRRLETLPNVAQAQFNLVCCEAGKAILYVGIREKGAPTLAFSATPQGKVRLPQEVLQAGEDFQKAFMEAVLKGNAGEDDSQGHALMNDHASRAVQQRFITFAAQHLKLLRDVLHHSSDAEHRALAAQVIAYAANKQDVVKDLVEAMRDSAVGVRNNAMRALEVMAELKGQTANQRVRIPVHPFVEMLNSIEWTDRNKSSLALFKLTEKRDPSILSELRQQAILSLIEMAGWKSTGHANAPFVMLGRVADFPEKDILGAWEHGDHKAFIALAAKRIKAK